LSRKTEKLFLVFSDIIFINLAWALYYLIRVESGWISYANPPAFLGPMIAVYIYWIIVFTFAGLYQHWFVRSRFDEFASVFKAVSIGSLILFFAIFVDDMMRDAPIISRYIILFYWLLMVLCVGTGRVIIRSVQRSLLQKGIGLRNSFIVGSGAKGKELLEIIETYPQLGYKFSGFITTDERKNADEDNIMGRVSDLPSLIKGFGISEILIALDEDERSKVMDVIKYCSGSDVNLKIMPDTYEIVSGLAKTNQIYGVPLIEVMPDIMSPAATLTKRIIDIIGSVVILVITFPIVLIFMLLIKLTSKGPLLYTQERVGKNGQYFTIYKFRTMIENAEEYGPEWSGPDDPRITRVGKILRKTHIDEIPQLVNVLKNEMSIVGPRPERPFFVEELKNQIPYYYKRLSVKPGITGWAQIKYKYDVSLDDVKSKLQFDFYYIENMSLTLDLKIILNTIIVVLLLKGR
jgi:exopolysaccharide biosynthesis polyprenyl glycosylphosphotransferase